MEHTRCAYCRNPIRARQRLVLLARAAMSFHGDCWGTLHATVQQGYVDRVRDEGVGSLLQPYQRAQMASWLPEAAIDAAVESLTVHLEASTVRDDADV